MSINNTGSATDVINPSMLRRDMRSERPDMVNQSRIGAADVRVRVEWAVSVTVSSNFEFPRFVNSGMANQRHENVVERCAVHNETLHGTTLRVDLVKQRA